MAKRTVRKITCDSDPWPVIDAWARETGYGLKQSDSTGRLYQKGVGFLVAPMMLEVRQSGPKGLHLEAWVRVNLFVRICAFFIIPSEMGIESGGFRLLAPRKIARTAVNKLLQRLNQQPIP